MPETPMAPLVRPYAPQTPAEIGADDGGRLAVLATLFGGDSAGPIPPDAT